MIAEECRKLREQLEEVAESEKRENIHKQLESRRDELAKIRDTLLSVTDTLKAISARCELASELDPTKCIDRVRKIRESMQTDPLSITKGHQFTNMRKAFEKFATEGSECAHATWAKYMPRAKPSVDTNQLAEAEQQNDFKTTVLKLRTRAKYAEKLGREPPANEDDFAELESAWEDIREMMAALPDVAPDPLVQEFLKAANSPAGASIDSLTDEVRSWLQENNIAEKYRINTM